jgi:hypothetical protein
MGLHLISLITLCHLWIKIYGDRGVIMTPLASWRFQGLESEFASRNYAAASELNCSI